MRKSLSLGMTLLAFVLLSDGRLIAATMNNYCVVPPFIQQPIKPNLLMIIDNSASMYDLQYQDTLNKYCANRPTQSCTTDSNCSGYAATCVSSVTSSSSTTTTAKACTGTDETRVQCPNSTATTTPKSCATDADCNNIKNDCNKGLGTCKTVVNTIYPCNNGFCTNDFITTTNTIYTPIACTTDATCNTITTGDTCNNKCSSTRQCYDTTYSAATTYYGYFDPASTYRHDFTTGNFVGGAAMPGSCTYSAGATKYMCVNTTGSGSSETIVAGDTGFVATGNFLNWLTTSKFDVQKKILTGGKYDTTGQVVIGETRGCSGREFIKAVPGINLTFAIRGGTAGGITETQSQATEYGQTYIGIYAGTYNAEACLSSMDNWLSLLEPKPVNQGTFQGDLKDCVGAGNSQYNAVNIWNHIIHNCYDGILGKAQGYKTNLNALETECKKAYDSGVAPSAINDLSSGIAICSSVLSYTSPTSGLPTTGYLGKCYDSSSAGEPFNETCALEQMENFCRVNVSTSPVLDPSSTTLPASSVSLPSFMLAQGLMNTVKVASLPVKIASSTAPTGLIQQFNGSIRFGAMAFNTDGSASECGTGSTIPCSKYCSVTTTRLCYDYRDCPSGETCNSSGSSTFTNKDAAKIISFVGAGNCSSTTATACDVDRECPSGETCISSVGNHSSGLIKVLGDLKATTWTPHAEAYYNALAYFTKDARTTTTTLPASFAASTAAIAAPLTSTSSDGTVVASDSYSLKNPIQYRCQKNNILLITDGATTADKNKTMKDKVTDASDYFRDPLTKTESESCGSYYGSPYLHDLSYYANYRNIFNPSVLCSSSSSACDVAQKIRTFVVYNGTQSAATDICDPYVQLNKTAVNGGTALVTAQSPAEISGGIESVLLSVAGGTASGTAASIVNKRQESGANLLTAVFYPEREFIPTGATTGTKIKWTGDLQNYWYYFDPYFANSGLVEDTTDDDVLNLKTDYRIDLNFSEETRQTTATRYSFDGKTYTKVDDGVPVNSLKALWRAGDLLHVVSASDRTIKTNVPGTTSLIDFKDTKKADLRPYLQSSTEDDAVKIINYTRGDDTADAAYRNRTVTYNGVTKPWKLGDIISSTPKIQSSIQVNNYNRSYNDTSYNQFVTSSSYKNRNVVYVGANDGMLHAFSLGKITAKTTEFQKASIAADGSISPGSELWAYIPGNALPYLRYLADPQYRHLYTVDLTSTLVDVSIAGTDCSGDYWTCDRTTDTAASNWRTLLVGGMGLGGASRPADGSCATSTTIESNIYADCVKAPINSTGFENVGLSSYFALDVTTPTSPSLKWEFSHADLGYALLEPALLRVGGSKLNGRWFAVFVSGPTGPINTSTSQFYGRSDKTLKLFVVDMATGSLVRTFDVTASDATIKVDDSLKTAKAFGGPLYTNAIDLDEGKSGSTSYYSTDVVYVSYTRQKKNSSGVYSWDNGSDGGILRLLTNGSTDPASWTLTSLIDGTGPVTSSMAKMYDDLDPVTKKPALWLYFGTGRYFYVDQESVDAANEQQYLFGFKEPCYKKDNATGFTVLDKDCAIDLTKGQVSKSTHLYDGTTILSLSAADYYTNKLSGTEGKLGWYALLDLSDSNYNAERVITTPLVRASGVTSFTTFRPTADICGSGGATRMIFRDYRTGGMPAKGSLKGSVVVQLSTGAIVKIDLAKIIDAGVVGGKPPSIELGQGKPPGQAPQDDKPRKPVKKVLHIQEK